MKINEVKLFKMTGKKASLKTNIILLVIHF